MATKRADFGAWVKERLDAAGVKQAALSTESGIVYPTLNRLLNSGREGRPMRPDDETVERIAGALVRLGAIDDAAEAWAAAAPIPDGYQLVRASPGHLPPDLPALVAELPPDIQEMLPHILRIDPERRPSLARFWVDQAVAHVNIQGQKEELERELNDLLRRLAEARGE